MTDEKQKKDPFRHVKNLMQEMQDMQELRQEMDEVLAVVCADEIEHVNLIKDHIRELQSELEVAHASMQEKAPDVFEDITRVNADVANKESALKKMCHALDIDLVRKGVKISEGRIRITISKSSSTIAYSENVLKDHPEFEEMYVDGDPLVMRRINSSVLERLVTTEGILTDDEIKKYRVESRTRNPSISIKIVEKS